MINKFISKNKLNESLDSKDPGLPKIDKSEILNSSIEELEKQIDPETKAAGVKAITSVLNPFTAALGMSASMTKEIASSIFGWDDSEQASSKDVFQKSGSHPGLKGYTEEDIENLGKMLFVETSLFRSDVEHEAIIQVALNRAASKGTRVYEVVKPLTGGWNNSKGYDKRWAQAHMYMNDSNKRWVRAKASIIKCLKGQSSVNVGDAENFLHPNGMKRKECHKQMHNQPCPQNFKRMCFDFDKEYAVLNAGSRCVPKWAVWQGYGGRSPTKPKLFGKALVCMASLSNPGGMVAAASTKSSRTPSQGRILIVGDSLLDQTWKGTTVKSIGYHISQKFKGEVDNQAVGGSRTHRGSQSIKAVYNSSVSEKTKILVINGGINDIIGMGWGGKRYPLKNSTNAMKDIITDAVKRGIKVIVLPIVVPYRGQKKFNLSMQEAQRRARSFNKEMEAISSSLGADSVRYISGFEEISVIKKRRDVHPYSDYVRIAGSISAAIEDMQ